MGKRLVEVLCVEYSVMKGGGIVSRDTGRNTGN